MIEKLQRKFHFPSFIQFTLNNLNIFTFYFCYLAQLIKFFFAVLIKLKDIKFNEIERTHSVCKHGLKLA